MSYFLLPKNNNNIKINIQYSNDENNNFINTSILHYYNQSIYEINKIILNDPFISFYDYEKIVKNINPYQCICSKISGSNLSVSKLKSKTLLFYDIIEINQLFDLFSFYKNANMYVLSITPNMEDFNYYIDMMRDSNDKVLSIPILNKESYSLINNNRIKNSKFNFIFFEETIDEIDSVMHINSIIKILLLIINCQENNGVCLIKLNNTFYKTLIQVLYIFSSLFEKVYIIKPTTSNPATFEKYIVCKNFIMNKAKKDCFVELQEKSINHLFNSKPIFFTLDKDVPYYFLNKIYDLNSVLGQQQLEIMEQIKNILKIKNKDDKIEFIKKSNIQKSILWCEKFKIPCNKFVEKTNIFLPVLK
jgi:hypothetical protein